ncbi:homeobox protein PKNOX2 isoform X1 [Sorex araneus]|uniref:homeobox protein PKNOX2 isoform X1 n=1 Tax=Sorex araneus TaxID=42254 RepID=UPI0003317208|nr:homeobox protein PKNOX2 isoform X1 [Sorex araneus]XP_054989994.1 homeobox protein PKNOX2 isoform X1 [Sorex araneus]XP_054989995.1 homeobox protein PKNOX2 isoform X1 [Sorex araneus]XP_054989996.1 homeobox protein PKNOX2 isoform X1 [Sorex araneus]XP_054989997.1 homeobox protein PKNOX2 isoform X1 [Sorex araneus]XP_054989998.1 homeobox protein PKNOX2 isoform X1 [Sorex araneus]XP_054989999.1 homeobox protein PKNOX2 isoform X1 [Sorex araneus]XP_055971038.1 homeobox protein PKNOX2 isoform X1 [So
MQHASPAPALTMMATQSVPAPPYQDSPQMTATAQTPSKAQAVHIPAPAAAASTPVPSAPVDPQAQLEADKRAVYRHPLFPLLTLLFEKCEQATQGSECITSASFDVDIENFVHQQEQEHKPFFSDDPELDNLMVKAIQVLRIHLLELEKVNELCKDFCNRYITCLKTKMHSDNLLRNDLGGPYSPNQPSMNLHSQDLLQSSPNSMSGVSANPPGIVVAASTLQPGNIAMTTVNSQVVSGGALYQPVTMVTSQGQVVTQAIPQGALQIQNTQVNLDLTSLLDNEDKKSKNKRGVLPKHATNIMRSWLFQHLMHPYPTEDEKRQIAAQTNLTLLQVNNWFINARRRILQPMLDASNPDPAPKAKKIKSQHRPTQRFWPNSIAAGVLQPQGGAPGTNPDGSINLDNLQSLSSDNATIAMQQAMMAAHDDSLDGTEEEEEDEMEEEEEEELEEEADELQTTNVSDLGLEHSDSLE